MAEVQAALDHASAVSRRNFIRTGLFTGAADSVSQGVKHLRHAMSGSWRIR